MACVLNALRDDTAIDYSKYTNDSTEQKPKMVSFLTIEP